MCKLYGFSNDHDDVKECSYLRFSLTNQQSQHLTPSLDTLEKHTWRANSTAIWRRAPEADPRVPCPVVFGCTVRNDNISIDWMSLPLAPEALLDMIIYGCTGFCCNGFCSTGHCTCNRNGLSPAYRCLSMRR